MKYGFVEGKNGFNCVLCGTHRRWTSLRHVIRQHENPPEGVRAGTREPLVVGCCGNDGKGPSGQTGGGGQRFINHSRRQRYQSLRVYLVPRGTNVRKIRLSATAQKKLPSQGHVMPSASYYRRQADLLLSFAVT